MEIVIQIPTEEMLYSPSFAMLGDDGYYFLLDTQDLKSLNDFSMDELYRLSQLEDFNGLRYNNEEKKEIVKRHKKEVMLEVHHELKYDCTNKDEYDTAVFKMYTNVDDALEHIIWIDSDILFSGNLSSDEEEL